MVGDPADADPRRLLRVRRPGLRHLDRAGRHDRRGDRAQQHPARPELPHQRSATCPPTAATAAATTTARCRPRWSTTPPTSRSPRSPAPSATPADQPTFAAGRRTGGTCWTPPADSTSAASANGSWVPRVHPDQRRRLRRGRLLGLHRDGAVRPGRAWPRPRAATPRWPPTWAPCCAASPAPTRLRLHGQRAQPRAALGVRLRRRAVPDPGDRARRSRTSCGPTRPAAWPTATTTSAR